MNGAVHLAAGIQCLYLVSVLGLYFALVLNGERGDTVMTVLSYAATAGFVWQFVAWKIAGGSLFSIYLMFLTAATLFNGGQIALEAFNLNDAGLLAGTFDAEILGDAVLLVFLSLGCLHLGALLSLRTRVSERSSLIPAGDDGPIADACRKVGTALLLLSIVPAAFVLIDVVRISNAGGYGALYERAVPLGGTTTVQLLSTLLVPGAHFLLAGSKRRSFAAIAAVLTGLVYTLALLWGGYRAMSLIPFLTLLWVYHQRIRRIRGRVVIFATCVVLIPVLASVRETRMKVGAARISWETATSGISFSENPAVSLVSEMGGTLGTVAHTVALVPSERPFDWGMGYVFAATTVFPNLFWDVHPGIVKGSYTSWLIWRVNPWIAEHGGSLGFSFVAEAYANFGWLAPLFMIALGFGACRYEQWSLRRTDAGSVAAVAVFGSFLLFFARAESNSIARGLVWYAMGPLALVQMIRSVSGRLSLLKTTAQVPGGNRMQRSACRGPRHLCRGDCRDVQLEPWRHDWHQ